MYSIITLFFIVPIFYVPFTFEVFSMLRSECGMQLVEAGQVGSLGGEQVITRK